MSRSILSIVRRLSGAAAIAAAASALVACGPDYQRMDITNVKGSRELGGTVTHSRVSIPEGMIVKANVTPWNDDDEKMQASIVSQDTGVVEVLETINDRDYAFIGHRVGRTTLEFRADGRTVLLVDAEVTPQPSQP